MDHRARLTQRLIVSLQAFVLGRAGLVLAASLLLAALAAVLGLGVEFRTSRSDLAPADDPDQRRFDAVSREFAGASDVVACVEAAPGASKSEADLRAFADDLAARFGADPLVAQVYHKIDLDWLAAHAFYLAPADALEKALDGIASEIRAPGGLGEIRNLAGLNIAIASRLEAGMDEAQPPPEEEAGEGIAWLSAFLDGERRFLENPDGILSWLDEGPPLLRLAAGRPELAAGGYLATRDGGTLFVLASPASQDDSLPSLRRFVGALRAHADLALAARPGFAVAFTGEPAMTVEEMGIVRRDTWLTAVVAAAGVVLLTFLVFRWRTHALLVLAALAVGVVWALGAVRLELGYLNLITSSFISTLVGVGVAYAIHPVSEYEMRGAHADDPERAIREAYHATGAAVTTGAVTTAGAFFSILLMPFRGFAELGLVAGVGIVLCLAAALLTLPAIVVLYGRWRHARDEERRSARAALDRIWVESGAGLVCAYPKTVTAAAIALTIALAWAATGVGFDTNIVELLPRDAESVRYLERMMTGSDLSPNFNIAVADDLASLRRLRDAASKEPSILRVDSVLDLLPEDPERSRAAAARARELLAGIRLPAAVEPSAKEDLAASLGRLEEAIDASAEAAFGAGMGSLAGPLEEARGRAAAAREAIETASPEQAAAWREGQERVLAWAGRALSDLERAAAAAPPEPGDLPAEMRSRLMTRSGRFLALLQPAGSVFDPAELDRFDEASRRVAADVTGFPILFRTMSERITSGFHRSAIGAAVIVFLILLADFRSLREAGLALLPLGMGVVWMLGAMKLLGLPFNFANLVAVPLIIGVGIDNGVHVVHRLRLEGSAGMTLVLRHTGRAILIASLTTMIGFGSLALASHRGMASLGAVLLIGVGACLVTSTLVLPNILVAAGKVGR